MLLVKIINGAKMELNPLCYVFGHTFETTDITASAACARPCCSFVRAAAEWPRYMVEPTFGAFQTVEVQVEATKESVSPIWIVNDLGELGIEIDGHCFFMYKGRSLEYKDGCHSSGSTMRYRVVDEYEYGETCWPMEWIQAGVRQRRYTRASRDPNTAWQNLPVHDTKS